MTPSGRKRNNEGSKAGKDGDDSFCEASANTSCIGSNSIANLKKLGQHKHSRLRILLQQQTRTTFRISSAPIPMNLYNKENYSCQNSIELLCRTSLLLPAMHILQRMTPFLVQVHSDQAHSAGGQGTFPRHSWPFSVKACKAIHC